eukprot:NODE_1649_length_915_cov_404.193995_g1158_i0.p1 GENE.NODE_1649_length_915_cov_404.193995_g1158_i0~~NODE_1649_length_915_cov_404.193995_g1158_i0.p1  ORF type:complete len:202 (+),score=55.67 NODE_1649_length_915_cov_404.193995_g1158_i0:115-720(+)
MELSEVTDQDFETPEIIDLNVGGTHFTTTRTTLASDPDSMLAQLVHSGFGVARDSKGRIFIDRDPFLFRYVLNYLRDGTLHVPSGFADVSQLQAEAQYFQLHGLACRIDDYEHSHPQPCSVVARKASNAAELEVQTISSSLQAVLQKAHAEAEMKVDYLLSAAWDKLVAEMSRHAARGARACEIQLIGRSEPEGRLESGRL